MRYIPMTESFVDESGYPDEACLGELRSWPYEDFTGAMLYAQELWWPNEDFATRDPSEDRWTFITSGWSGNEDVIQALKDNMTWWNRYWESTHRGGKFIFRGYE